MMNNDGGNLILKPDDEKKKSRIIWASIVIFVGAFLIIMIAYKNCNQAGKQDMIADADPLVSVRNAEQYGQIEQVGKQILAGTVTIAQQYKKRLTEAGVDEILSAKRIAMDTRMEQSFRQLDAMDKAFADYRRDTKEWLEKGVFEMIAKSDLSEKDKAGLRTGFITGQRFSQVDRMMELEEKILVNIREIMNLFKDSTGHWTLENDQIVFQRKTDQEKYNKYMEEIGRTEKLQADIRQSSIDRVTKMNQPGPEFSEARQ